MHDIIPSSLKSTIKFFKAEVGCILLNDEGCLVIKDSSGFHQNFDYSIRIKIGEGLIGKTAKEGKPLVISNFNVMDPYIPFTPGVKSALILPLKIEKRLIGVIYLESKIEDFFKAGVELLQIFSTESAVAISRAQLQEEKEKTMDALFTTTKSVAAGQLASGFLHEVKNSLNIIALELENTREKMQIDPDIKSKEEYIEKISIIDAEISRSCELSNHAKKFSQRLIPRKVETYLNDVVKNTLKLLDITIRKKEIRPNLKLDPALNKHEIKNDNMLPENTVYIDKGQIEQVIINLILNALEASEPGGRLLLETVLNDSIAEIKITDYGKGIKDIDVPELFKPFFTTKPDGVGLGLYISKIIIEERHQGKIIVDTEPDKRTIFSVQLPIKSKIKELDDDKS